MIKTALLWCALLLWPGALLAQSGEDPPVTILISIDGFRPDYLDRGLTPNLNALATEGVRGALTPSFPTKTFPNHYALVTGLRPDRNGIVGNTMLDPRRPGQLFSLGNAAQSLDPFWWDEAEPVWVTAERAGVRTATMYWPGSEVAIHEVRPSDWWRYDQNVTDAQRVRGVLDWMRRPAATRPRFVTLYFDAVDTAGHRFGPDSEEVRQAIVAVDARIGELVAGLAEIGEQANLVVVSDHGMTPSDATKVVDLATLIDLPSILAVETGQYAAIEPAAGTDDRVFQALLGRHEHFECWRKEALPARLHYGRNARVPAIVCLADRGWTLTAGPPRYPVEGGDHGGDNADPGLRALFLAAGPGIARGAAASLSDNVEVYPVIMGLIGVTPLPNDATGALWRSVGGGTVR